MAYLYLTKQIGIALAFGIWAYIVAKGLFAGSSLRLSLLEEIALLVPAGLAVAIGLLFGLGIVGVLAGPWILAGAGLLVAFACWRLRDRIVSGPSGAVRAIARRETLVRLVMIAIVGTVLVPVALKGLTPPTLSDEVRYHLPYALNFAEQGRIVPDLYLRYPFHTLNVNLLYAAALVFGDDVTPHYIHLLLGCLAGLSLYVLAVPKCGRVIAFCAVVLFLVTPLFPIYAPTAIVDFGLAAFVTATIACLDRARGRPALVICAGLTFGAALGTKYLALALFPLVVAWAAYRTRAALPIARFAAVAVLAGAPWYVYNIIWTGNPISPFAGEWFGSWPWTAEDLARQTEQLSRDGRERSLWDLVALPYDLAFAPHQSRRDIVPVPELLAFGLMTLVLLPWWNPKMRPYGVLVLVVVTGWFFTVPIFRYLAAILPVWCLISAWSAERTVWLVVFLVARRQAALEAVRQRASHAAAAIVLVLAGLHYWHYNRWFYVDGVVKRVEHRDRFLRKRIPVYGVAEYLRQSGAHGEVVLAYPPGALFSYARTNRIVGDEYGPMRLARFKHYSLCKERFVEALEREGISLFVLTQTSLFNRPDWKRYLASRLTAPYADQHATVYRIESGTEPPYADPQENSRNSRHATSRARTSTTQVLPYFPVASDGFRKGLVRIVNHSDWAGTVVIRGVDDTGMRYGPITVELGAREARHFGSDDWVSCDFAKRVSGDLGDNASASWWLSLATDLDIETLSYIRTEDEFITSMHEVARTTQGTAGQTMHYMPFFNSGDEGSHASHLRLINPGDRDVDVTITGRDDAGETASEEVRLPLPGGTACWLSARELESGASDDRGSACGIISGRLGDGQGTWRLSVAATGGDIQVMSLLVNPAGHLTNMSASAGARSGAHTLPLVFPVSDSIEEPQGFVRVINHSNVAGTVEIHGIDDTGTPHGPVTLALDVQETVHLDSGDLESGDALKGLPEGLGDGDGYWRLRLTTELDIEALAYLGTEDGFVASMHGVARAPQGVESATVHYVPFFSPGRRDIYVRRQVGWVRLSNSGRGDAEVTIEGRDMEGLEAPKGVVSLTLPAGQACMVSAQTLESGKPRLRSDTCAGEEFDFAGRFGAGAGEWSLYVVAEGGEVQVMSLLKRFPEYLANLSDTNRMPTGRPAHGK